MSWPRRFLLVGLLAIAAMAATALVLAFTHAVSATSEAWVLIVIVSGYIVCSVGLIVVGHFDRNRELDEIARRVAAEDAQESNL